MMQQADGQVLIRAELDTASVTAGITAMRTALDALRTYAARQLASIRSQVQSDGKTLVSDLSGLASRLVGVLASGVSGGSARITSALRGVLSAALGSGNDYAPRFSGIGTQIISGIIGGIQGSASALWNTLREVAANMLNTLKSALGIRSPSQRMREEVGWQISSGISHGMLDRRPEIMAAAETLAADAVGRAGAMLRGGVSAPASNVTALHVTSVVDGERYPGQGNDVQKAPQLGGNTFIFQKPVETPYRHAQAIREVMEEMLYGV